MDDEDLWSDFRIPEPEPEPGTFPPRELWKEFPDLFKPTPVRVVKRNLEPRGKPIPGVDQTERWSVDISGPCGALLFARPKPDPDNGEARRLKFLRNYLDATCDGLRHCNGMFTDQWIVKRWAYLWNSSTRAVRVHLPHNQYDNFDPNRLILYFVAEIGRLVDRVSETSGFCPRDVRDLHSRVLEALSYQHDPDDPRYFVLAQLHYVLFWTEAALIDEFEFATGKLAS